MRNRRLARNRVATGIGWTREGSVVPPSGSGESRPGSLTGTEFAGNILATAKGTGYLAGGTFFSFACRFVIALVLARGLGAEGYGLYVLAVSAAGLFAGVSMLGIDDAMVRYVAILSGRGDRDGLSGTLQLGLVVGVLGGLAMGAGLFVCAGPIAEGLFDEPELARLLRLLAAVVPFLTLSSVLLGTARGFRRMGYAAFAETVVQSVVRMGLVILLALAGWLRLYTAAIAFGLADVAASITLIALLNRAFPLREAFRRGVRRDVREIFRFAIPLWLSGLLRQSRRNIQNVILGAMSSVASVGIFSIANQVSLAASVTSTSIYVSSRPAMAQLHDVGDREELARLYATTTRWTFGLNIPFFLIIVLYPEAILGLFGGAFENGATALIVVAFAGLVGAATGTCQGMIDMTGHTRVKLANAILNTVVLVGGGAVLIPRSGVIGAAVASLIAIATVNVASVLEVWVLEGHLPFDRDWWKPLVAGLGALALGLALRSLTGVGTDLVPAVLQGAVVAAAYVGLVLALGLAPDDRLVIGRAFSRIGLSRMAAPERST
jgi:O-antigen/teichoic acid export membrane protein